MNYPYGHSADPASSKVHHRRNHRKRRCGICGGGMNALALFCHRCNRLSLASWQKLLVLLMAVALVVVTVEWTNLI